MEKTKLTVTGVRVFDKQDTPSVELQFATAIAGYKVVNGVKTATDVNTISINRSQLTKELCSANDLIDEYRGCRTTAFDQKAFSLILRGAELTIVREAYSAGDVIPDRKDADGNDVTRQYDGYETHVVGVRLTDRAAARLDDACSLE